MILNQKIGKFTYLCGKAGIPGLIMSDPGIGKSTTLELYSKLMNMNLTVLIASQYAPDDILGIQSVEGGKLKRLSPAWFDEVIEKAKNGKPNLLFIDELTGCDEFIQMPMLELIRTKKLGSYSLPEDTQVMAAGNYEEQLNKAFKMSMPMVNRFLICNIGCEDIDVRELLDNTIDNISKSDDVDMQIDYIGLSKTGTWRCLDEAKKFIASNVVFDVRLDNSSETGLRGFSSVRSISNSFDFMKTADECEMVDNIVAQCISDTLGPGKNEIDFARNLRKFISNYKVDMTNITSDMLENMTSSEANECVTYLLSNLMLITPDIFMTIKKLADKKVINESLYEKLQSSILNM